MATSVVQTNETLNFVLENMTSTAQRILEVGCGKGELAKRLKDLAHDVIAIDSSLASVEQARRAGVEARVAEFPHFHEEPFDVIIFTRSLHHITPLDASLDKARNLLKPSGVLIVEDFAFGDANEFAASWLYDLLSLLEASGVLQEAEGSFGRKLLKGGGEISLWHEHHHKIHSVREMHQEISKSFEISTLKSAPYLYRYVAEMLGDDDRSERIVSSLLKLEIETGAEVESFLLGRRFVARTNG